MLSALKRPQYLDYAHSPAVPRMRGFGEGGDGGGGRPLERKPSKLMQMREDYQKKIMKEKEEKMVQMYEDNQRKAMDKARAVSGVQQNGSAGGQKSVREIFQERRRMEKTGAAIPPIDNHFRQQAKGYNSPGGWSSRTGSGNSTKKTSAGRDRANPLAPIRRTSEPNEAAGFGQGRSGIPKSGIPQRRPLDTNDVAANNTPAARSGIPQSSSKNNLNGRSGIPQFSNNNNAHAGKSGIPQRRPSDEPPPEEFNGKPRLVKHRPLPPTNGAPRSHQNGYSNAGQGDTLPSQPSHLPKYSPQHRKPPQPPPHPKRTPQTQREQHQPASNGSSSNGKEKMTDFMKWQLEQNTARDDRLKKLNSRVADGGDDNDEDDGSWGPPPPREHQNKSANRVQNAPLSSRSKDIRSANVPVSSRSKVDYSYEEEGQDDEEEEEDEDEGGDEGGEFDDQVAQMEKELLEKIAREQGELERMKKIRQKEEVEESKERERQKKREAAEKAKQKKIDQQERKEEDRRRKEEDEEEKRERAKHEKGEIQRRKDEEKQHKEDEKLTARRHKEDEKHQKAREKEDEKFRKEEEKMRKFHEKARARKPPVSQHRDEYNDEEEEDEEDEEEEESGYPSPGRTYTVPKKSRDQPPASMEELDEMPVANGGDSSKYYAKAVDNDPNAKGSVGKLRPCQNCGRKFAVDRLSKHEAACKKNSKPRKQFDASKKRVDGTDMAKFQGKQKIVPKKKSNWRKNHDNFIENLRYAKKADQHLKEGKDLRELGPAPVTENPDLVACPHCNRRFNETAAERHIPRCNQLKTRPRPMNMRLKR